MGRRGSVDKRHVLEALLGQPPLSGFDLCSAVSSAGRRCTPGVLLPVLLALEDAELVSVDRSADPYRYALTPRGSAAAHAASPGRADPAVLVMVDLVGFTRFTGEHGDVAAHEEASRLASLARSAVAPLGGALVKSMGDGVLLSLPAQADPEPVVRSIASGLQHGARSWQVHAAAHVGHPIRHSGDVFGADVNLVARLCSLARAGELIVSAVDGGDAVQLSGVADPVRVRRVRL